MSEAKTMNRWLVVVGALLIQLCLGAIYAWSVFTPGLTATQPMDFANIYTAKQLGIQQESFHAMNQKLEAPAQLEGDHGGTERDHGRGEEGNTQATADRIDGTINTIVQEYVPEANLKNLRYGFSKEQSQWIFSIGLAFFAIVMVLAGRMMPKIGPRNLAALGGLVLGAGYVLAGLFGGQDFMKHLIFIGIIGGSGIGLAYVVPIAVAMRWFPDKKGLITGLAVAGFGFGAMGWVKLAGAWLGLIAHLGLPTVFIIYGIAFFVTVGIGSIWMVFPPEGWQPAGWTPPAPKTAAAAPRPERSISRAARCSALPSST